MYDAFSWAWACYDVGTFHVFFIELEQLYDVINLFFSVYLKWDICFIRYLIFLLKFFHVRYICF